MDSLILKPGRDRSVRRRHPWVMSGAIASVEGTPQPGDLVAVIAAEGEVLGHAHVAPASAIRARMVEWGKDSSGDDALFASVRKAVERRAGLPGLVDTDAARLVNAEGDGLPGLVVDRYAGVMVVRPTTAGMQRRAGGIAEALRDAGDAALLRPDAIALRREGVPIEERTLFGQVPEVPVSIRERDRVYGVDVRHGQKTGFYLDQREARDIVAGLARGRRFLDLFSYTGGFSVAAAVGGASEITAVDSSKEALERGAEHLAPVAAEIRADLVNADAFRWLRGGSDPFDLIVIDPPPLARRRADVSKASRGYKDLLMHGMRRVTPGGDILAFSCSHHVGPDLFRKIAFGAALDAERRVQVLGTLSAPVDHPVSLDHPEGDYLSGLWLRRIG
jgi:23S rRNA (cytosine1962-C5)-methyltransferase